MTDVKKKRTFRIAAALLFPALLLMLEATLIITDAVPDNRPVRMSLTSRKPLFINEGGVYRTNPALKSLYPDVSFPARKSASVTRVFIVGGSTAMGFPVEKYFSPATLLQTGLNAAAPGKSYEVINAAGFAIASYECLEVIREIVGCQPDAIILMTGHNEFMERRFLSAGPDYGWVYKLRSARLARGLYLKAAGDLKKERFKPHSVTEEERVLAVSDFAEALSEAGNICSSENIPLIVVTMPSNILDYRPFGPSSLKHVDQVRIDKLLQSGDAAGALRLIEDYIKDHPADAWLLYERGRALWELAGSGSSGKESSARRAMALNSLTGARDHDPWPVRAITDINGAIGKAARSDGIFPADFAGEVSRISVPPNFPGDALFFDHCHPREETQLVLARLLMEALEEAGAVRLADGWERRAGEQWLVLSEQVGPLVRAGAFYQIAYEAGVNMSRVERGLGACALAMELAPDRPEVKELYERLYREKNQAGWILSGD